MSISRRTVLKQFLFIAGGVTLIPSCMQRDEAKASIPLKRLKMAATDERTLAELAETIIPATNTPGAKDLYVHQYAMKMVDDCSSPEDVEAFEKGLKAFDKFSEQQAGKPFAQLAATQRNSVLTAIEAKKEVPEDVTKFYNKVKGLSIQGYLTSKYYLTKVQVYELVPGRYRGCVPVSEIKKPSIRPV